LRKVSRWDQFVAMSMAQLSGKQSLRDIEANLKAQRHSQYHLGAKPIARTSLARLNERQPYTLYEGLFYQLLQRCKGLAPAHKFRFNNPLISLDSSIIDLSLKIFPWSDFNTKRGAVKLHLGLDHGGHIPVFANVSNCRGYDVHGARHFDFPEGSILIMDKGHTDYAWYKELNNRGIFFVTRLRSNAQYQVLARHNTSQHPSVTSDQRIRLSAKKWRELDIPELRRVGYRDPETGKHYVFLTNHFDLSAKTIAAIYKDRWQVELFFKTLKQNLKIDAFVGTSLNAVKTQIWIALCMFLLMAYLKFVSRTDWSVQRLKRLLQVNLFARMQILELARPSPPPDMSAPPQMRLAL